MHDLLTRANDGFTQRLGLVRPHQWPAPTPCAAWDVQALVNHVVRGGPRARLLRPASREDACRLPGPGPSAPAAGTTARLTCSDEPTATGCYRPSRYSCSETW
jgi:Mycothiol maleylpyruvate isomerase N-terminal domain